MVEWLAGNRIIGTTAERPLASLQSPSVGGWVEIGRTTLGSVNDDIVVSSLADKRYYMVLTYTGNGSGNIHTQLRLNSDTGSNYSYRFSDDGAADVTGTSKTLMASGVGGSASSVPMFGVGYLSNLATKEKLWIQHGVGQRTAGAGTAPNRRESVGKHAQTTNPISAVTQHNGEGGDFTAGAEVVVLGWDPADTHTSNFWEELGSDTGDGANADLTVSGITAKKYLWIQFYLDPDATHTPRMRFNSDTGSNYSDRYSINGGTDGTDTSSTGAYPGFGGSVPQFYNIFMINNSANEKLGISHNVYQGTAGAGTAPERGETVIKWANTSEQITTITIDALAGTPNLSTSSYLKVWGSD